MGFWGFVGREKVGNFPLGSLEGVGEIALPAYARGVSGIVAECLVLSAISVHSSGFYVTFGRAETFLIRGRNARDG